MRMLVQRDALIRELDLLRPLFTSEACQNVELSAENGRFTAKATDLWSWLVAGGEAAVVRPGNIRVKALLFHELLKLLPKGELAIDSEKVDNVSLSVGDFTSRLVTPVSFPGIPNTDAPRSLKIGAADAMDLIKRTQFILDDHIAHARVLLLAIRPGGYRMVCTDGHRLAMSQIGQFAGEGKDLILTKRVVERIKAMLDGFKGDVEIRYGDKSDVTIVAGERTLYTKQASIAYPPYERILPPAHETSIRVSPTALAAAAKRTVVMLQRQEEAILTLKVSQGGISVEADGGKEEGQARELVESQATGPVDFELRVRAAYLIEALLSSGSDSVTIGCTLGHRMPVTIQGEGGHATCLIMPIGKERSKDAAKTAATTTSTAAGKAA